MAERWKWQPSEMMDLPFDEFCLFADAVRELNKMQAEANKPPSR